MFFYVAIDAGASAIHAPMWGGVLNWVCDMIEVDDFDGIFDFAEPFVKIPLQSLLACQIIIFRRLAYD